MNFYRVRYMIVAALAVALMLVAVNQESVFAQSPEIVSVTAPADGETISGIVTLAGVVDFHDFLKYDVFLKGGGDLIWVATVFSPVINGNLAQLDTKTVMDGGYQVVIRLVRSDSNYTEYVGPSIVINNGLGASLPFSEVHPNFLYPPPANYSVARISNCGGLDMEFDYVGITQGCSHANLWMKAKLEKMPLCTIEDVLLRPCTYRGTAVGLGERPGATYQFDAVAGKIYEIEYAGGGRIFIRETKGDERAETDTGGAAAADPERFQKAAEAGLAVPVIPTIAAASAQASDSQTAAPAIAAPDTSAAEDSAETVLPESGRAAPVSKTSFIVTALGVIALMVIGGIAAAYSGKQTA